MPDTIRLISGTANPAFAKGIDNYLQKQSVKSRVIKADISAFPDGETRVQIRETIRGYNVYVVQPTCPPVNDNLMELCAIIDALKRASVQRITAVIPYLGYARQEKKDRPRVPITAKLAAQFIEIAGANKIVTMDLHSPAIQGFFNIPVDDLLAGPVLTRYFKEKLGSKIKKAVIVSPDVGGTARARAVAQRLKVPLAIIEKRRDSDTNEPDMYHLVGDVKNKIAIFIDDIISTGGTLITGVDFLQDHGAKEIYAGATHGIFAGKAISLIENSHLEKVVVTDTIPLPREKSNKIDQVSVVEIFADVIRRIHENRSVSAIFLE